ncbi:MAG TPA: hypothetical protein VFF89_13290 [Sphingobium sp.]|nr:hypothetical protein [Sphingobium sp.]
MGKGNFLGGNTVIGAESGWFTWNAPKRRKPRKGEEKAKAAGAAFTERCRDERENWDHKTNKTKILTKEEFEKEFGKATSGKESKQKRKSNKRK